LQSELPAVRAGRQVDLREKGLMMPADTTLIYELALAEGDQYAALLAAILNGVGATRDDAAEVELVVEEPDF
jgi:hypothetical protein